MTSLVVSSLAQRQTAITVWLNRLPQRGGELGVSRRYFAKHALELRLDAEELDCLMHIRAQFGAGVVEVFKLIGRGEDMDQVAQAYRARQQFGDTTYNNALSIKAALQLLKRFPELEDDDDLHDKIIQLHGAIQGKLPWVKYANMAIRVVCEAADYYKDNDLWAVVDMIVGGDLVPES